MNLENFLLLLPPSLSLSVSVIYVYVNMYVCHIC